MCKVKKPFKMHVIVCWNAGNIKIQILWYTVYPQTTFENCPIFTFPYFIGELDSSNSVKFCVSFLGEKTIEYIFNVCHSKLFTTYFTMASTEAKTLVNCICIKNRMFWLTLEWTGSGKNKGNVNLFSIVIDKFTLLVKEISFM